ncbi:putative Histidine kinase [Hyella patelloides LEGE 07179]|uniref:Circadian input-output histidine kinase CikA n=1 Tax=Hyella patelloides LEGE 07179 TaxID=945734 RepID=A0A563VJC2_9CYAN|nr:PAS domain S-box protein [Hyella patelloides]VEP11538.1 putative Histidine kinase [Hyella patelloides LEGE 07179]
MNIKSPNNLAASLQLLQSVIDRLPQTIFWKDINSIYLGCDQSFAKIAGLKSPQEIVGKNDYDLPWTKEEADWYQKCDRRVMENNAPEYGIIESQVRADGKLTWIETNKIPLHDETGSVIGIVGTFEDITERQEAAEKMKKSLKDLSDFQYALSQSAIISIMDADGVFTYVNDRFCKIFQYSASELIGSSNRILDSGYHSEGFWQQVWTRLRQGKIWQGELHHQAKDGSSYWVNATIIPSLNEKNKPIRYLKILENINQRKKAEAALEYQLQKTKLSNQITQAIHQSLDAQEIFDTATKQIRQFLQVAQVGIFQLDVEDCSLTERDGEETSPYPIEVLTEGKFVAQDRASNHYLALNDRLHKLCLAEKGTVNYQQGEILAVTDTQKSKAKSVLALLDIKAYMVIPLLQSNKLWGLFYIFHYCASRQWQTAEIAFMKKVATQLGIALYQKQLLEQEKLQRTLLDRQNQQLKQSKENAEQANLAKSAFLANMSHELRTPLNVILGFSQIMYRDSTVTPQQKEILKIINQSGEHLLALINDVLEVTKIEAGKTNLKQDNFDLHHLLDSLKAMLQFKAEEKGLKLIFERSHDVPIYVQSDQGKVRQILINLINNAIKFTAQGEVRLVVTTIPVREQTILSFAVQDTGVGIAEAEIANLFNPFVQTEAGIKSQQGTGLGLSISRKFARLMKGDITVESQLDRGSTFTFTLPVKAVPVIQNDTKSTKRAIALAPDRPSYRILVVDDKTENRLLLNHLLTNIGFEIKEAANGQESIDICANWYPHLVLMDIHLPVMNGIDATIEIKNQTQDNPIPVIALTASVFEESKIEVLKAGCDDFLSKPIRDTLLFEKIAEHIPVTYVYEVEEIESKSINNQNLELENLSFMPNDWLKNVNQAACQLNEDLLLELIAQIPDEQNHIVQTLINKINNFDFDEIIQLSSNF